MPKKVVRESFSVSQVLGIENFFMVQRSCHDFRSKSFCLTVPKSIVGESFCVSENFCYRKNLWIEGGRRKEYQYFISNLSCLIVSKSFVGASFSVSQVLGIEKFYA